MHLDRRFLDWGVFFIVLGAIPLAVQQGLLDRDLAARAWQLWPLLIIAGGVGLLLRRTSLEFLGGLVAAAALGAIAGGLFAVGADFADVARACGGGEGRSFPSQQGTLPTSASVGLEIDCGDVTVTTAGGSSWTLAGTAGDGQTPEVAHSADGLEIQSRDRGIFIFGIGQGARDMWALTLPTEPTLRVDASINAGSGRFVLTNAKLDEIAVEGNAATIRVDLTGSTIGDLDVEVNAGSARVQLPNASLSGRLEANAGSLAICLPDGVGLRVSTNENITGSNNFAERGLTRSGDTYETANYGAATNRIQLEVDVNAASVTLNPEDGCQ